MAQTQRIQASLNPIVRSSPPETLRLYLAPPPLQQQCESHYGPFCAILNAPKTHQPISPYNLRLRRAMAAKIRTYTETRSLSQPSASDEPLT
jgi:hypothetical protein